MSGTNRQWVLSASFEDGVSGGIYSTSRFRTIQHIPFLILSHKPQCVSRPTTSATAHFRHPGRNTGRTSTPNACLLHSAMQMSRRSWKDLLLKYLEQRRRRDLWWDLSHQSFPNMPACSTALPEAPMRVETDNVSDGISSSYSKQRSHIHAKRLLAAFCHANVPAVLEGSFAEVSGTATKMMRAGERKRHSRSSILRSRRLQGTYDYTSPSHWRRHGPHVQDQSPVGPVCQLGRRDRC